MLLRKFFISTALIAVSTASLPLAAAAPGGSVDRLDRPATMTRNFSTTMTTAIARAGNRLLAVGIRGLIIASDDQGKTWKQMASPVASDLLAIQFPTPEKGWITGHDGVVLHSPDGGKTWKKQLDGRMAAKLLTEHFESQVKAADPDAERRLKDVQLNYRDGPEQALLDLFFEDDRHGMVVGSFGTILQTSDGGVSWTSMMEKVDTPDLLHYNAIRAIGGDLYIGAEMGKVFRFDRIQQRFSLHETGYAASFFALTGNDKLVLALGLRGNVYRSLDKGKTWAVIDIGLKANINAAIRLADGRFAVVSQNGRAVVLDENAANPKPLAMTNPSLLTGLVQVDATTLALSSIRGVQLATLK